MSRRLGPRPLALHLAAALSAWTSSPAAWPTSSGASTGWKPPEPLASALPSVDPEALREALGREARRRLADLAQGIVRYWRHPYARELPDPPALWAEGATRLLDYSPPGGRPLLVVPSLVNRAAILDLSERASLLRWLASQGLRPLLVDWGPPGEAERRFTLTDIVAGRLSRALDAGAAAAGGKLPVLGYCMGGLLAVALAGRRPHEVSALALLATPWDFHAGDGGRARSLAAAMTPVLPLIAAWGELPVDLIQALFAGLDPLAVPRKFVRFAALDPASPAAHTFVALEDWLNDGVPLAAPVAIECLAGWYGANTPARGLWRIEGRPVDPGALALPSLHVIPDHDRIVPPASALALARAMAGAETLRPPLGHIGMIVGSRAPAAVWRPLAGWLRARA